MKRQLAETHTPWFAGTKIPMKLGGMVPGGIALMHAVKRFRPDVLHFHSETPEACGAVMLRRAESRLGVTSVRTIHNSIFWRYWPRIGRWCDRQLDHAWIACVSEAAREEFVRYRQDSGAMPPSASPRVIYNGVNVPQRLPRKVSASPKLHRLLFAGRFEYQKGTDVLCTALPHVRLSAESRAELTFLGQGAHEPLIRKLAASPPSGWTIHVQAPVADLALVLPEFDLVVMPSRFEGLGMVAIEATLCGLPVVATDASGLRETLPPEYPWRAAPGDAASLASVLTVALALRSRWAETVESAQRFTAARFSASAMNSAYRQLYAQASESRCDFGLHEVVSERAIK
jgi:glycosyltransferase involved in cell wall biosynthesis